MSDEDLIGYLFDLLDPNERAAVAARVQTDPAVAERFARLRADAALLLTVAEAEREEPPAPPTGLAVRTIARVAQHVVEHEPRRPAPAGTESPVAAFLREYADESPEIDIQFGPGTRAPGFADDRAPTPAPPPTDGPDHRSGSRFRADLLVAACLAFVGIGLVLSGIARARYEQRVSACQNSLRTLHNGLAGYADHDPQGRYPQVGTPAIPTADAFATSLVDLGHLPAGYKPGCPATPDCPAYTYTLGFRAPNKEVVGLRRPNANSDPADENDLMPISADLPTASAAPGDGPVSPHGRCMNVLFVGGHVRPVTSPHVGPNGDDIYRNVFGHVAAGADRTDAVLGRTGDRP
jgi:prepilin-type processing-associated H-X9-DG protein